MEIFIAEITVGSWRKTELKYKMSYKHKNSITILFAHGRKPWNETTHSLVIVFLFVFWSGMISSCKWFRMHVHIWVHLWLLCRLCVFYFPLSIQFNCDHFVTNFTSWNCYLHLILKLHFKNLQGNMKIIMAIMKIQRYYLLKVITLK